MDANCGGKARVRVPSLPLSQLARSSRSAQAAGEESQRRPSVQKPGRLLMTIAAPG
jgi:hypothetical protein